jgi:Mg2+ and Co2+ transporter CorA|tara:strand:+ start:9636 stop:9764 length:129 start_codon:yes stop_codon:yes gene_type:complete
MLNTVIPLVDWGMGTAIIVVFGVVCVVLVALVFNMVNSDKKK